MHRTDRSYSRSQHKSARIIRSQAEHKSRSHRRPPWQTWTSWGTAQRGRTAGQKQPHFKWSTQQSGRASAQKISCSTLSRYMPARQPSASSQEAGNQESEDRRYVCRKHTSLVSGTLHVVGAHGSYVQSQEGETADWLYILGWLHQLLQPADTIRFFCWTGVTIGSMRSLHISPHRFTPGSAVNVSSVDSPICLGKSGAN